MISVFLIPANGFQNLSHLEQVLHFGALLLIIVAIALIMTPASCHRIAERGVVSRRFVETASRLLTFALLPLIFGPNPRSIHCRPPDS
jgi:Family of unknown function (DUF6328)